MQIQTRQTRWLVIDSVTSPWPVELGPNNVEFKGAIVARVIIADGSVSLVSDETLTNWHP